MRCKEVQESLAETGAMTLTAPGREHLERCSVCQAYARDWGLLRSGFRALAAEQVAEASLGFAARVARRIEEAARRGNAEAEFLERVGRRVVYVTSVLALVAILALALPSSGPVRSPASADLLLAQSEVVATESNPIFAEEASDNPSLPQAETKTGGEREKP